MCLLLGGEISLLLCMIMFNFYALFLIGCHYQKGGECWGMVSSLLVLMNDKPCVLMCSMKGKWCILLIRAMDKCILKKLNHLDIIWSMMILKDTMKTFIFYLSLSFICEEPSLTIASIHTHAY